MALWRVVLISQTPLAHSPKALWYEAMLNRPETSELAQPACQQDSYLWTLDIPKMIPAADWNRHSVRAFVLDRCTDIVARVKCE